MPARRRTRLVRLATVGLASGAVALAPLAAAIPAHAAGGSISGTVTAPDGTRLSGIQVDLYRYSSSGNYYAYSASTTSTSDGTWGVFVDDGQYKACFTVPDARRYAPVCWGSQDDVTAAPSFTVAGQNVPRDVTLPVSGDVYGRVTDYSGKGLPTVALQIVPVSRQGRQYTGQAYTAKDGTWRATHLVPGYYHVYATDYSANAQGLPNYDPASWRDQGTITIIANDTIPVSIDITMPARLTGSAPTISGALQIGDTVTANAGSWGPGTVSLAWQWKLDGVAVPGATSPSLVVPASWAGHQASVTVTGKQGSASPLTFTTAGSHPVWGTFADVPAGGQFSSDIDWMYASGISTGWVAPDGGRSYQPLSPVARNAMAAFLYRVAGRPAYTPTGQAFADVPPTAPFYKEIEWMHSAGLANGWRAADGTLTYRPLDPIGRDAMAAFLYRWKGSPAVTLPARPSFSDVPASSDFAKAIEWMRASGISTGWPDGTYRPASPVNRDAMAAFLHRASSVAG